MALTLQTIFENSDDEIDVVTVEDEESDGRLVNFDALIWESPCYENESDSYIDSGSDAEDTFIDVVNTSNAFLLETTDNDDSVSNVQEASTSFNDTDILRQEVSTKTSLKRKRHNLDTDDNTGEVYSKRNKINKQTNQSSILLYVAKLNHPTSESNQAATEPQRRRTSCLPVSPTNSPKNEKGVQSFTWFHCPKCNAEKIFDSADEQKNDLECINCVIKMCKGQLQINEDKLKCILVTCVNCNLKTEATNVCLDSAKCPKCMSNIALSCRNCSKQVTGLLETFYHVNKKCKFDFYNCHQCNHKYIGMGDLESHIRENHTSVVCPICRAIYKTNHRMQTHKRLCNKPANIQCCFCYFSTKFTQSLRGHLANKHAEKFKTSADFSSVYKQILENRSSIQSFIPPSQNETDNRKVIGKCNYYCPKCKKIVATTGKFNEKSCLICNSLTNYQCNKCGVQKKSYKLIYRHLRYICYPKEVLSCNHCNFTTTFKNTLIDHMKCAHMYKEYYYETRSFKLTYYCLHCEKTMDASGPRNKKQCPVCKTILIFQCNKCYHKYNSYTTFIYHINDICHP